jgi:hypothetical protein
MVTVICQGIESGPINAMCAKIGNSGKPRWQLSDNREMTIIQPIEKSEKISI